MDYRARVLKAEGGDMLDLPGHKVTAKTVGEARVELRRRLVEHGYKVRSISATTDGALVAYVVDAPPPPPKREPKAKKKPVLHAGIVGGNAPIAKKRTRRRKKAKVKS